MKERTANRRHSCCACENDILPGQSYTISGRRKTHKLPMCEEAVACPATEPQEFDEKALRAALNEPTRVTVRKLVDIFAFFRKINFVNS